MSDIGHSRSGYHIVSDRFVFRFFFVNKSHWIKYFLYEYLIFMDFPRKIKKIRNKDNLAINVNSNH
jgi:hypothetical protein